MSRWRRLLLCLWFFHDWQCVWRVEDRPSFETPFTERSGWRCFRCHLTREESWEHPGTEK